MTAATNKSGCCALVCIFIGFVGIIVLGTLSIIYSQKYGDDDCIGHYSGISFNYKTWLLVYGICEISGTVIMMTFIAIYMIFQSNIALFVGYIVFILYYLFSFNWWIVGSILFFTTINKDCANSLPAFQQFGLAIFIINLIIWVLLCLGKQAHSGNRE